MLNWTRANTNSELLFSGTSEIAWDARARNTANANDFFIVHPSIRFMTLLDRVIARSLPLVPKSIVRRVVNRYIAGVTTDDAMRVVASLNARGFRATLDILGEHVHNLDQAHTATAGYLNLLEEIAG